MISPNIVTVGTSSGVILLLEASGGRGSMSLSQKNDINDRHIQSGIAALCANSNEGVLCAADTTRNLVVFRIKSSVNITAETTIKFEK